MFLVTKVYKQIFYFVANGVVLNPHPSLPTEAFSVGWNKNAT